MPPAVVTTSDVKNEERTICIFGQPYGEGDHPKAAERKEEKSERGDLTSRLTCLLAKKISQLCTLKYTVNL